MIKAINKALEKYKRIGIIITKAGDDERMIAIEHDQQVTVPMIVPSDFAELTVSQIIDQITGAGQTPEKEKETATAFVRCHCIHKRTGKQCVLAEGHDGAHKLED